MLKGINKSVSIKFRFYKMKHNSFHFFHLSSAASLTSAVCSIVVEHRAICYFSLTEGSDSELCLNKQTTLQFAACLKC